MKSPFPGMDPYLEDHWRDVHHRFLTYASDDLQPNLPKNLRARLEERVFVEPEGVDARSLYPDIRVIERPKWASGSAPSAVSDVAVAEPIIVCGDPEPPTEGFIEIIDVGSGNRVVTVIELLSASNKYAGEGQEKYLKKQRDYRDGKVSLVEIDLLRGGKRVLAVPKLLIPLSHRTTYSVCVTRGWKPSYFELYALPLRNKLPTIKVPLRESDQDVPLDLQAIIERCYRNGAYDDIDYRHDPSPPLSREDEAWIREHLTNWVERHDASSMPSTLDPK